MNPEYKDNLVLRRTPRQPNNCRAIILVDVVANTATRYNTVGELLLVIGHKSTSATSFVGRYADKLYKKRYKFIYAEDYTGVITNFGPSLDNIEDNESNKDN